MKPKIIPIVLVLIFLAALLVLVPSASGRVAQIPAPASRTVAYSGHLSSEDGGPVADGAYAFTFALYDSVVDGSLFWSETQSEVPVKEGEFSVQLGSATPLPGTAPDSSWLEVSVRGQGETYFTTLYPRQLMETDSEESPFNPSAGSACAHDHFAESWVGSTSGTSSQAGLRVENTGIKMFPNEVIAIQGVVGENASYGMWAEAVNGTGLYGKSDSSYGVNGISIDGTGVYGQSTDGQGVVGYSQHAFAMVADGDAKQSYVSGGWIKAMALVSGTTILRCYNSQAIDLSVVDTPPCGFSSTGSSGDWTVQFSFIVDGRFVSVTPWWGGTGTVSSAVSFPNMWSVRVRLSQDSGFFIVIY